MIRRYFQNNPSALRLGGLFAGLVVLPILLGYWFLNLAHWDLSIPLVYGNPGHDEIWQLVLTKMLTDTGWVLTNPFMGAPDIAHWHYHSAAQTSALHSVIMLGLSAFIDDAVRLQQFYYLINFSLISLASYWCARRLGIDRFTSACIGLLFSFTTFRFDAPFFAFLVNYFAIPLAMIAVFDVMRGTFFNIAGEPEKETLARRSRALFLSWPFLIGLLSMFVVATADGYYAFFTLLLLGFSLASRVVAGDYKRALSLAPGILYIVAILATVLSLLIPLSIYKSQHRDEFFPGGKEDPTLIKRAFEAEVYSSSLKLLLSPPVTHRSDFMAKIGERVLQTSNDARKYPNGRMIAIGTLGAALLAAALLLLASPTRVLRLGIAKKFREHSASNLPMPVVWAALPLSLFALLCSTAGGIGSIVALVYPTIRAYDRFPLFLLFTLYVGAGSLFSHWLMNTSRKRLRLGVALLGMVVIAAIWDQVPRTAAKTDPKLAKRYLGERAFVKELETSLPPGSMIYQYPYSQYLSDNKYYGWGAFSHLRMYLHSHALRWSNGASKNSPVDDWHLKMSRLPARQLFARMHDAGFNAIVFDRAVLPPEEYRTVITAASQYTGSPVTEDPVSGLAYVKLPDRGYKLLYDETYKNIKALQVTNLAVARQSKLSETLNQQKVVQILATQVADAPFLVSASGILDEQTLAELGAGDTKIIRTDALSGSLSCDAPGGRSPFTLNDRITVRLQNSSKFDWHMSEGQFPLGIGIHITDLNGQMVRWDDGMRLKTNNYVSRGESLDVSFAFANLKLDDIPAKLREFRVVLGVVQDGNTWFPALSCNIHVQR